MKTFKSLFGMAMLALMAASCSNDITDVQVPEQIANDGTIHFTATLAPKSFDATTRALVESDDHTTLHSNWVEGDEIKVKYQISNGGILTTKGTVRVDDSGAATIEADFSKAVNNGSIDFFYPYELADITNPIAEQDGELSYKLDIRKYSSTMKVEGTEATVVGGIKMEAQYAIVGFSLGSVIDDNIDANKLVIFDGDRDMKLVTVTSSSSAGNKAPYVALPKIKTDNMRFWAKASDKVYFARGTADLEAGKYYQTGMKMARPGDVIGADGKFYEDAAMAEKSGTTAEAMVAWIQDDVGTNGPMYAIALEDYVNGTKEEMPVTTATDTTSKNNWKRSHKIPFGEWDLPSAAVLALMFNKADLLSYFNNQEEFPAQKAVRTLAFRTMLTNAGGTDLKDSEEYWTGTFCAKNSKYLWILGTGGSKETSLAGYFKSEENYYTNEHYVRYILEF